MQKGGLCSDADEVQKGSLREMNRDEELATAE